MRIDGENAGGMWPKSQVSPQHIYNADKDTESCIRGSRGTVTVLTEQIFTREIFHQNICKIWKYNCWRCHRECSQAANLIRGEICFGKPVYDHSLSPYFGLKTLWTIFFLQSVLLPGLLAIWIKTCLFWYSWEVCLRIEFKWSPDMYYKWVSHCLWQQRSRNINCRSLIGSWDFVKNKDITFNV